MQNLEPNKEDRKKFDIDLQYGKVKEKIIADMLQDKKIEVKDKAKGVKEHFKEKELLTEE